MQKSHASIRAAAHPEITPMLKSILFGIAIILPSVLSEMYLKNHGVPAQYAFLTASAVVFLAVLDFIIIIAIEPFRRSLSILTIPTLLSSIAVIFLYMVTESLNRFFEHLGYAFLSVPVVTAGLLIYVAILWEKKIFLKSYLCLNSIALELLWAMGNTDKITMPF
ncbi:MAG: hypothetical protein HY052_06785 [Proteobacteria bacterium]|nr:hypothetical protein [Pseudomonadota bacterium]